MPITLAKSLTNIAPSTTRAMTARARALADQGRDIIALTQGEPDFDTPAPARAAGIAAIQDGHTRYTPVPGVLPLRVAIAGSLAGDHGLRDDPEEIIVGCGAKQVIFNAVMATLEPGDEVIVPAPCWVTYPEVVKLAGGVPVIIDGTVSPTYKITPEQLDAAITHRTRWLILNSPANPSGAVYSAQELEGLAVVLRAYDHVAILCDEVYDKLVYTPAHFASLAALAPDLDDRILIVNGVSKAHAMTGWRVGYGAGPAPLIKAMTTIQGQTTSHTSSIAQYAAIEAIGGDQSHIARFKEAFRQRRDLVCGRLQAMTGLSCPVPDGAFYVLVSCRQWLGRPLPDGRSLTSDIDVAMLLLERFGVAVVPGTSFLAPGHLRISYAAALDDLDRGLRRIQAACDLVMAEAA